MIHLRQLCLVTGELAPVIDHLEAVFGIERCYVDPGVGVFGLENTLLPVGSDFLEVVAPVEDGTAAGRYLQRRRGDGGYMVICQADSAETQDGCRTRAAERNVRVAWEREHDDYHLMQLHPGDLRASFLEIDTDEPNDPIGHWEPAGGDGWRPHMRTERTLGYRAVELQDDDPAGLAELWGHIVHAPVRRDGDTLLVALANVDLRFVAPRDDRGPGLCGIDLAVADAEAIRSAAAERGLTVGEDSVDLCGVRFRLLQTP
jgi:hypothetical protein